MENTALVDGFVMLAKTEIEETEEFELHAAFEGDSLGIVLRFDPSVVGTRSF